MRRRRVRLRRGGLAPRSGGRRQSVDQRNHVAQRADDEGRERNRVALDRDLQPHREGHRSHRLRADRRLQYAHEGGVAVGGRRQVARDRPSVGGPESGGGPGPRQHLPAGRRRFAGVGAPGRLVHRPADLRRPGRRSLRRPRAGRIEQLGHRVERLARRGQPDRERTTAPAANGQRSARDDRRRRRPERSRAGLRFATPVRPEDRRHRHRLAARRADHLGAGDADLRGARVRSDRREPQGDVVLPAHRSEAGVPGEHQQVRQGRAAVRAQGVPAQQHGAGPDR